MKVFLLSLALGLGFALAGTTGGSNSPDGEVLDFAGTTGGSNSPDGEVLDFA